jgi:hypothetical protein
LILARNGFTYTTMRTTQKSNNIKEVVDKKNCL